MDINSIILQLELVETRILQYEANLGREICKYRFLDSAQTLIEILSKRIQLELFRDSYITSSSLGSGSHSYDT